MLRSILPLLTAFALPVFAQDQSAPKQPSLVNPLALVEGGYAATFLKVSGQVPITRASGKKESIGLTMPVWARKNTIAIPNDRLAELIKLCEDTESHASRCKELEAATIELQKRWLAILKDPSNQQWSVSDEN